MQSSKSLENSNTCKRVTDANISSDNTLYLNLVPGFTCEVEEVADGLSLVQYFGSKSKRSNKLPQSENSSVFQFEEKLETSNSNKIDEDSNEIVELVSDCSQLKTFSKPKCARIKYVTPKNTLKKNFPETSKKQNSVFTRLDLAQDLTFEKEASDYSSEITTVGKEYPMPEIETTFSLQVPQAQTFDDVIPVEGKQLCEITESSLKECSSDDARNSIEPSLNVFCAKPTSLQTFDTSVLDDVQFIKITKPLQMTENNLSNAAVNSREISNSKSPYSAEQKTDHSVLQKIQNHNLANSNFLGDSTDNCNSFSRNSNKVINKSVHKHLANAKQYNKRAVKSLLTQSNIQSKNNYVNFPSSSSNFYPNVSIIPAVIIQNNEKAVSDAANYLSQTASTLDSNCASASKYSNLSSAASGNSTMRDKIIILQNPTFCQSAADNIRLLTPRAPKIWRSVDQYPCVVCKKTSTLLCRRCLKIPYCSDQCANTYWHSIHHKACTR